MEHRIAEIENNISSIRERIEQNEKTIDIIVIHLDAQIEILISDMERTLAAHHNIREFKSKIKAGWFEVDKAVLSIEKRLSDIMDEKG